MQDPKETKAVEEPAKATRDGGAVKFSFTFECVALKGDERAAATALIEQATAHAAKWVKQ